MSPKRKGSDDTNQVIKKLKKDDKPLMNDFTNIQKYIKQ